MSDFDLCVCTNSMSPMTFDEYEKLPREEKEHIRTLGELERYLIGRTWTKSCSTIPTKSTARTFGIAAQES